MHGCSSFFRQQAPHCNERWGTNLAALDSLAQMDGGKQPAGSELLQQVLQQKWGQGRAAWETIGDGGKVIMQRIKRYVLVTSLIHSLDLYIWVTHQDFSFWRDCVVLALCDCIGCWFFLKTICVCGLHKSRNCHKTKLMNCLSGWDQIQYLASKNQLLPIDSAAFLLTVQNKVSTSSGAFFFRAEIMCNTFK